MKKAAGGRLCTGKYLSVCAPGQMMLRHTGTCNGDIIQYVADRRALSLRICCRRLLWVCAWSALPNRKPVAHQRSHPSQ